MSQQFHDHGSFVGPCSPQKHAAIRLGTIGQQGVPASASFEQHLKLALEMTVQVDGAVLCACCRHNYTQEPST